MLVEEEQPTEDERYFFTPRKPTVLDVLSRLIVHLVKQEQIDVKQLVDIVGCDAEDVVLQLTEKI